VIMRAMSADPKARYRSVKHLGRALLPFSSARARVLWEEPFRANAADAASDAADASGPTADVGQHEPGASTQTGVETVDLSTVPRRLSTGWTKFFAVGTGLVAAGLVAIWAASGSKEEPSPGPVAPPVTAPAPVPKAAPPPVARPATPPPEFAVTVTVDPPTATWELDGTPIEAGDWEGTFPLDHQRHVLRAMAPGFEPREEAFTDAPPSAHWVLRPKAATSRRPPPRPATRPREQTAPLPPPSVMNPNGAPVID